MNQIIGLNKKEVKQRLLSFGYNELPSEKPKNILRIAIEVFKEPMFILLVSCGLLYIIIGDVLEGSVLLASILIIISITFYHYQKTEKALNALKQLASPKVLVVREGKQIKVSGREIVPDDIVLLNEGDRISADGILIEGLNLSVDESILTGESIPVLKSIQSQADSKTEYLYSGTLVTQGHGMMKVIATGLKTEFGKIGTSLLEIKDSSTRLQIEMKKLIKNLFLIGIFISIFVVVIYYFTRGNFIQALLNGLTASMAILPEEFPVVLTIFIAMGAWRLTKKNVLTRKPSTIETLGSATILCSDKTGTITQNKMEVTSIYAEDEMIYKQKFLENNHKLSNIVQLAYLASQKNAIDPMEIAFAITNQLINKKNTDDYTLIKEYPFQKSFMCMTRVLKNNKTNKTIIASKGAPETIFNLCKFKGIELEKHIEIVRSFAEKGLRVLAVAYSEEVRATLPDSQSDFIFKFSGIIGLEDPIRPEVPQAIKECQEAGVKVVMITGDFPTTARSIAKQIGLNLNEDIMTGSELNQLTEKELAKTISKINIFARIIPEQKLRIVQAFQANNEIVAMTGDGVNDAPALKAANIGIAMGNKGTDVAREAASIVLLDDNFSSIVSAIRLGRKIFDNLQKAMSYILAIHIPIIGLTLLPVFIPTLPILLMPLHIVFLELIIDPICAIAFEQEQEEAFIMNRKPRNPREKFFGKKKILESTFQGLLLLIIILLVYYLSIREVHINNEVRAITFATLIMGNLFLIITNLSKTRNFFQVIYEKNWPRTIIISIAIIMLICVNSIPILQTIFQFKNPGFNHFLISILGASFVLLILEIIKFLKYQKTVNK